MNDIIIQELVPQIIDALREQGYAETSIHRRKQALFQIAQFHNQCGEKSYCLNTVTKFIQDTEARYKRGEIMRERYKELTKEANRLSEFHTNGVVTLKKRSFSPPLPDYYDNLLNQLCTYEGWSEKIRKQIRWFAKPYFIWLVQQGHQDLNTVGEAVIRQYIIYCSKYMTGGGLNNVKYFLKRICAYLFASGRLAQSYEDLLSFSVPVDQKIQPAIPQSEVAATLSVLERGTAKGKRDYAMLLLSVVYGLRSADITKLKLTDIDWKNGEIRIIQTKTGKSLALPLTTDVGNAIREYILDGRPVSILQNVFLSDRAPIRPLGRGAIAVQHNHYRAIAELPHCGIHGLRRAVGSNMVASGISVTTIAQVLGHKDINSTKQYISLDKKHLKECALDFTGIEPKGGAAR